MTDYQRIEKLLKFLGMNARALSLALGLKSPQIFYDIKANKCGISKELAVKIQERFLNISAAWLLTGEGEMLNSATDSGTSGTAIAISEEKKPRMIPFYDAETTGGFGEKVSSSVETPQLMGYIQPGDWFDGRDTAAIRHVGDSMVEYPNGCVLAVREVLERRMLVPGHNYVIETSEYRITKRIQRGSDRNSIALYSTNMETYPDGRLVYEPFEIELEDVRRIYKVLGYIVNQSGDYRLIKP